jgi:hypothetical protein
MPASALDLVAGDSQQQLVEAGTRRIPDGSVGTQRADPRQRLGVQLRSSNWTRTSR